MLGHAVERGRVADILGSAPVDALLAALGACAGMDVIGILRKKRQAVTAYEVALIGERAPAPKMRPSVAKAAS